MADIENCIDLDDIAHNLGCGSGNSAGIVPSLTYGYWDDVATWPDEPKPVDNSGTVTAPSLEEAGALIGDVAMKSGTRAFKIDFTEDAGNFTIVPDGQIDGFSFVSTLTMVKAKIVKKVLGFMNAAANRKMFFIVQDENGTNYLMGNKKRGASLVPGSEGAVTGTQASDRNQTTLQFTFRSSMALSYEGVTDELLTPAP